MIDRFGRATRALHWATAVCILTCALTGLVLYVGPLSAIVGRRNLVKDTHVIAGLAMPVPLVLAYAGRWRREIRGEFRRLARWSRADRRWLLSRGRDARDQVGKFNAGQKFNGAFMAGMIPIMLATGSMMRWFEPFPVEYRTGATFVHDWTAIATWIVVAGHILMGVSDRMALRGMVRGSVSRAWAAETHPLWAAEHPDPADPADPGHADPASVSEMEGTSP